MAKSPTTPKSPTRLNSPTTHLRALHLLALALGFLAITPITPIAPTAAIAKNPCTTNIDAHLYRYRARNHFALAAKPPPQPVLPESVSRGFPARAQPTNSNSRPRCPRPHLRRLAATAGSARASAATVRQFPPAPKRLPPTHLPQTRSPRPNRHIALGRSLAAGHPDGGELRRTDPSATSSQATAEATTQATAEGTTEASIEVTVNGSATESNTEASTGDYRYSWALGYQNYPARKHVNGLWVLQQNAQPHIDDTSEAPASPAHSLGQLWAIARQGSSCMSDVEIGWTVSSGQYGDLQPHLFIYAWDCGVGLGYVGQSSIPWVQYSDTIAPNAVLPTTPSCTSTASIYTKATDGSTTTVSGSATFPHPRGRASSRPRSRKARPAARSPPPNTIPVPRWATVAAMAPTGVRRWLAMSGISEEESEPRPS